MLSYRHAFHAGNHADVLKHYVLFEILQYFLQKDKPFHYIDTHAGAGIYALQESYAQKNEEYQAGISKLWQAQSLAPAFAPFVNLIKSFNASGTLLHYPGSPAIAYRMLRASDKLRLFELHPTDFKHLVDAIQSMSDHPKSRKAEISQQDGFAGIKSILPPPSRRAVALIDPPYEEKIDYKRVSNMLADGLKRFATGTFIIWYPLLQRPEIGEMLQALERLGIENWLQVSLTVQTPSMDGFGMHGSGLFIVNPPWTLPATLEQVMPTLCQMLALDEGASFELQSHLV